MRRRWIAMIGFAASTANRRRPKPTSTASCFFNDSVSLEKIILDKRNGREMDASNHLRGKTSSPGKAGLGAETGPILPRASESARASTEDWMMPEGCGACASLPAHRRTFADRGRFLEIRHCRNPVRNGAGYPKPARNRQNTSLRATKTTDFRDLDGDFA